MGNLHIKQLILSELHRWEFLSDILSLRPQRAIREFGIRFLEISFILLIHSKY